VSSDLHITVFGSAASPSLRVLDRDGRLVDERSLNAAEIEEFVERVDAEYASSGPDLVGLGEQLFSWLDGPTERWLVDLRDENTVLHLSCEGRLRHLPWELMADSTGFVAPQIIKPLVPVRRVGTTSTERTVANRPLRVLFMAASAVDVAPELDFEAEEAAILTATSGSGIELVVEESGSLEGLEFVLGQYEAGYFDVIHLTGHATVTAEGPRFVLEDAYGKSDLASADDLARSVANTWPSLMFLSGCSTAAADDAGAVPSMAEALVDAGTPLVLGWALPVGDLSATALAATIYKELASGANAVQAGTKARSELYENQSPYWHLLRMYADATEIAPLVTAKNTPGRAPSPKHNVESKFEDLHGVARVVAREDFVGRRRDLQRSLRHLRSTGRADDPQLVVLQGIGGLGKTTLAKRIVERLAATHQAVVRHATLDEPGVLAMAAGLQLPTIDAKQELNEILNHPTASLSDRVLYALRGPLASVPCLFVFDDYHEGNLDADGTSHKSTAEGLRILEAFADAIRETASSSRVILTSRYNFSLPSRIQAEWISLGTLRQTALDKKLRKTNNLGPGSLIDPALKDLAIETADGIPRLIEWLDQTLDNADLDHQQLFAAVADTASEFREHILAKELLARQSPDDAKVLAVASIFHMPVPPEAVQAAGDDVLDGIDAAATLSQSAGLGLIEGAIDPQSQQTRYLVPAVLRPLLADLLTEEQRIAVHFNGAEDLHRRWITNTEDHSDA